METSFTPTPDPDPKPVPVVEEVPSLPTAPDWEAPYFGYHHWKCLRCGTLWIEEEQEALCPKCDHCFECHNKRKIDCGEDGSQPCPRCRFDQYFPSEHSQPGPGEGSTEK